MTHTVWWGRMPCSSMIKQNKPQLLIPSPPTLPVSLHCLLERTVNNCPLLHSLFSNHTISLPSLFLSRWTMSAMMLIPMSLLNNWCSGHSFPHEIFSSLVYETLLFHQVLCSNSFVVTLPLLNLRMTEFKGQVLGDHLCTYKPLHRWFYTVLSSNACATRAQCVQEEYLNEGTVKGGCMR